MAERTSEELKVAFGAGEYPSSTDYADLVDTLFANAGGSGGGGSYTISETAPLNPSAGDVWFNSADGISLIYYEDIDSSQWVEISGGDRGLPGVQGETGTAGADGVFYTSDTEPESPVNGDIWFDMNNGIILVYYNDGTSSQWVEAGYPALQIPDLNQVGNVSITSPQNGQYFTYSDGAWSNTDLVIVTSLEGLSDTNIQSPAVGQTLVYNGTEWVPGSVESGLHPFFGR